MKKIILKTTLFFASALLLLSSCLGDGGSNNSSATGALAYINETSEYPFIKYAYILGYYPMRSNDLDANNNVSPGDFAYVDFKFNSNSSSNGMYNAEYIKVSEGEGRIFRWQDNIHTKEDLSFDTTKVETGMQALYLVETGSFIASADEFLDNKWVFSYVYTGLESDLEPELIVSYDPNTQYDLTGKALSADDKIVDLQLKKRASTGTGDLKQIKKQCIIDASLLRGIFLADAKDDVVKIRFRYYKEDANNKTKAYRLVLANPYSSSPLYFNYKDYSIEE